MSIKEIIEKKYSNISYCEDGTTNYFNSVKEDYELFKWGVAFRDLSYKTILKLSGKDVFDFLNRISTNTILEIEKMQKIHTFFLNQKGKIIDFTTLVNLEDDVYLIGYGEEEGKLKKWLSRYIISEDINLEDAEDMFFLEVNGSQAESYLTMIMGHQHENLKPNQIIKCDCDGIEVYCWLGSNKFVNNYKIFLKKEFSADFIQFLLNNQSVFNIGFVGELAYNIFRIKNGIADSYRLLYDGFNPYDVNLIENVSFTKGCYIGQEVIARIDTYENAKRRMIAFKIDCPKDLEIGDLVYNSEKKEVGEIVNFTNESFLGNTIGTIILPVREYSDKESYYLEDATKIRLKEFPLKL